ncbi:MAG: hypothetical protein IKI57_03500 [Clostridia bacterium]|nr:hypothetical protein [Clostridia bacterium]
MFRNLVSKKINIVSYIITFLVGLGSVLLGIAPLGTAFVAALVDQKIPILISFVISLIIYFVGFGLNSALEFLISIILFALFVSISKNKESIYKKAVLFALSQIISIIFLILVGLDKAPNVLLMMFNLITGTALMIVFSFGLKANVKIKNREKTNIEELISAGILFAALFSGTALFKFAGLTIFSIVCILTVMLLCWKKTAIFTLISSLAMALFFIVIAGEQLVYLLLFLIAGFASMLLSKAGRKGIIIGLLFTMFYCLFFAPTKDKVYSQLGYNRYVIEDFNAFLKEQNGSNEESINGVDFYDLEKMVDEIVNSPYTLIMKEMLIGFIILLILPNSFYKSYENITKDIMSKYEFNGIKSFKPYTIYLLNPGKNNEEPKENESENKSKTTNKKKTKGKSNKKQKRVD